MLLILSPEADTTSQPDPGRWPRVVRVRGCQSCVGSPHDLIELQELADKSGFPVVHHFHICWVGAVGVGLDHEGNLGPRSAPHTSDFLLLKSPLGQLDTVREEVAGHVGMRELKN